MQLHQQPSRLAPRVLRVLRRAAALQVHPARRGHSALRRPDEARGRRRRLSTSASSSAMRASRARASLRSSSTAGHLRVATASRTSASASQTSALLYPLLAKGLAKHKEKLEGPLAKQKIGFLHYATRNENIAILRRLAQRELSNVNAVQGEAAFVPGDRDRELRRLQVSHCAKGNRLRCDFSGKQLTHVACGHKSVEILSDLLDNCSDRIDISSLDKNGDATPHLACENGNVEIFEARLGHCRQAASSAQRTRRVKRRSWSDACRRE